MKILVLIGLDEWNALNGVPAIEFSVVRRARSLASVMGAEVHFAHLVHDHGMVAFDGEGYSEILHLREKFIQAEQDWLDELTSIFNKDGITATFSTQFANPDLSAVQKLVNEYSPDFILKLSRDHNFVLGVFSNLDWALIREAGVPTWFVNGDLPDINNILAAIDFVDEENPVQLALDRKVITQAIEWSERFDATLNIVHAYPSSPGLRPMQTTMTPLGLGGDMSPETTEMLLEARKTHDLKMQAHHDRSMASLAATYGISGDNVIVRPGFPNEVITEVAHELETGLIVMGATNLSRWERVFSNPNAELTLADAKSDILFIHNSDSLI
jgi:universal stress protein E